MKINFSNAKFIFGANNPKSIPNYDGVELAFIGRSNVGKSSILNAITGIKGLARTSNTPGRTQQINFFQIDDKFILTDLPGYGYAKISKTQKENLQFLIYSYLTERKNLVRTFLLIDSRHGYKNTDDEILSLLTRFGIPFQTILTKCDKVSKPELKIVTEKVLEKNLTLPSANPEIIETSSTSGIGIQKIKFSICDLLNNYN